MVKETKAYMEHVEMQKEREIAEKIKEYEKQIEEAQDKHEKSMEIIRQLLDESFSHIYEELVPKIVSNLPIHIKDLFPNGSEIAIRRGKSYMMVTVKFPSGNIRRFRFPIIKSQIDETGNTKYCLVEDGKMEIIDPDKILRTKRDSRVYEFDSEGNIIKMS